MLQIFNAPNIHSEFVKESNMFMWQCINQLKIVLWADIANLFLVNFSVNGARAFLELFSFY